MTGNSSGIAGTALYSPWQRDPKHLRHVVPAANWARQVVSNLAGDIASASALGAVTWRHERGGRLPDVHEHSGGTCTGFTIHHSLSAPTASTNPRRTARPCRLEPAAAAPDRRTVASARSDTGAALAGGPNASWPPTLAKPPDESGPELPAVPLAIQLLGYLPNQPLVWPLHAHVMPRQGHRRQVPQFLLCALTKEPNAILRPQ